MPDPNIVPRLEAAAARSWPSERDVAVGNWSVRVDGAMSSKRLNSINPLAPCDEIGFRDDLSQARDILASKGRPPLFRMTPLAGDFLSDRLDRDGWTRFETSHVLTAELADVASASMGEPVPADEFAQAWASVRGLAPEKSADVSKVIERIVLQVGLFVLKSDDGQATASAICVRDGDLAGFFEVAVSERYRKRGYALKIMSQGMVWAKEQGANTAWLQVLADNEAALCLYRRLGFDNVYSYHYRKPPGDLHG
ncbi:GNAT family N-acetyltransferase [Limoniibacter endophyticus]|uniref:GNAT family N-acetyltransferase n=1 Tax=Limoniibacter endophyticus TaxID=1565040 RepID=UPI00167A0485|nr:GNAT family N-acetyltransferase [Limoniibacter endophyticus]